MGEQVCIGIYAANKDRALNNTPKLIATVKMWDKDRAPVDIDALMRERAWKQKVFAACEKELAGRNVQYANAKRTGPDGCNVAIVVNTAMPLRSPAARKSTASINGRPIQKPTAPTVAALRRQGRRG